MHFHAPSLPPRSTAGQRKTVAHDRSKPSRLVAVVQDASERHDWPCDFDGPVPRPWSAFPRRANITFTLRPRVQQYMQFSLRFLSDRELATIVHPSVTSLTGEVGGQPVMSVIQLTDDPGRVSMGLSPWPPIRMARTCGAFSPSLYR